MLFDWMIYSGLANGVSAVRIARDGNRWLASPVWKNDGVGMFMSSPVFSGATLYGLSHRSSGQFFALDVATGKTLWTTRGREAENASVVVAGGFLLLSTTNAELIVARSSGATTEPRQQVEPLLLQFVGHDGILPYSAPPPLPSPQRPGARASAQSCSLRFSLEISAIGR